MEGPQRYISNRWQETPSKEIAQNLVIDLSLLEHTQHFRRAVSLHEAVGYYEDVSNRLTAWGTKAICLDEMMEKAISGGYCEVDEEKAMIPCSIERDFNTMLHNAVIFNPPQHEAHLEARQLFKEASELFQRWYRKMLHCKVCKQDHHNEGNLLDICDWCCQGVHQRCNPAGVREDNQGKHPFRLDAAWFCCNQCRDEHHKLQALHAIDNAGTQLKGREKGRNAKLRKLNSSDKQNGATDEMVTKEEEKPEQGASGGLGKRGGSNVVVGEGAKGDTDGVVGCVGEGIVGSGVDGAQGGAGAGAAGGSGKRKRGRPRKQAKTERTERAEAEGRELVRHAELRDGGGGGGEEEGGGGGEKEVKTKGGGRAGAEEAEEEKGGRGEEEEGGGLVAKKEEGGREGGEMKEEGERGVGGGGDKALESVESDGLKEGGGVEGEGGFCVGEEEEETQLAALHATLTRSLAQLEAMLGPGDVSGGTGGREGDEGGPGVQVGGGPGGEEVTVKRSLAEEVERVARRLVEEGVGTEEGLELVRTHMEAEQAAVTLRQRRQRAQQALLRLQPIPSTTTTSTATATAIAGPAPPG